jgi:predicted TIM-barrel fold metal-dependent hydrolase
VFSALEIHPLAGLAALGLTTTATAVATPAAAIGPAISAPSDPFRIDMHCHHIPDFYRTSLAEYGIVTAGGIPIPSWSPLLATAFMNAYAIAARWSPSPNPASPTCPPPAERLSMARQINDWTRDTLITTTNPLLRGRFGGFAVLPLCDLADPQDITNACAEATRAVKVVGMDGIGLYSGYHGVYLGDPRLEPLRATLDQLGAMVFIHPVTPAAMPSLQLPTFLFEFSFDTTRAAVNLLFHGVYTRYPGIHWLLAHAGGTLPFLAYRTSLLTLYPALAQNLGLSGLDNQNAAYAGLLYDTALSPAPSAMQSVRQVTGVDHVMFATDWPFSAPLFVVPGADGWGQGSGVRPPSRPAVPALCAITSRPGSSRAPGAPRRRIRRGRAGGAG